MISIVAAVAASISEDEYSLSPCVRSCSDCVHWEKDYSEDPCWGCLTEEDQDAFEDAHR